MQNRKPENIIWHDTSIKKEDREKLLGQKGVLLWFTGLSGSGKSTVANAVEKELNKLNRLTYLLDGDNIRHGLNSDLGFNIDARKENIRRIGEVAKLFVDAGIITLATFISPLIEDRNNIRNLLKGNFIEIFIDCSLENCEKRDPKGLYKKARAGEIKDFTGINSPYESPVSPEITVNTDTQSPKECAAQIINYLKSSNIFKTKEFTI